MVPSEALPSAAHKSDRSATAEIAALTDLTTAQHAAVTHRGSPLLVLAGPGTGKTRTIVARMAWLVTSEMVPPQNLLALTFTERAARELADRAAAALPLCAFQPWIGTFHSFGEAVLREEAFRAGLDPHFQILSNPEAILLLSRHVFELPGIRFRPPANPTKFVRPLEQLFREAKDQGVTPEDLAVYARTQSSDEWAELARAYAAYLDLQRAAGVLDVGDLVHETIRLFRQKRDSLARFRTRYPHILVDEFQDTNRTQGELLCLLAGQSAPAAGPRPSLFVVSDDDQAIYAFRGSNVANVLQFPTRFSGAKVVVLSENFRSPPDILNSAYALIQRNNPYRLEATAGIRKKLVAASAEVARPDRATQDSGGEPRPAALEHRHFATEEEEFAWVGEEILRRLEEGFTPRDIAVLARTNALLADLASPLQHRDIPHLLFDTRGLLGRPEIRDALAYFRLLRTPTDSGALFRLLSHPALEISPLDRARLLAEARAHRGPILALLYREALPGVRRLASLLTYHLEHLRAFRPSAVYLAFLERSRILQHAVAHAEETPEILPNLQAFLAYLRSLERGLADGDLFAFHDLLETAAAGGEGPPAATLPPETNAVRLLTVHGAKGLEFPLVFLVGATDDRFPSRGRARPLELPRDLLRLPDDPTADLGDRESRMLEERRLFYVALTRAQRALRITSAQSAAGMRRTRRPSPFLAEAGIPTVAFGTDAAVTKPLRLPLVPSFHRVVETPRDEARVLSPTKIETYARCPLQYAYRYVHRVPVPPHHALSFGNTLHAVLKDLGDAVSSGQRPTVEDVLRWYQARWIRDGYDSAVHEESRKKSGRDALSSYLATHDNLLTQAPLAAEASFSLPLPSLRLTGRIDRLDTLSDGRVLVTDFKTGSGKGRDDVRDDFQLSFYALAIRRAFRREPARLRLAFLEEGRDVETQRTTADDQAAVARAEGTAEKIRAGAFAATPGFHCRFCDFRNICDFAELP